MLVVQDEQGSSEDSDQSDHVPSREASEEITKNTTSYDAARIGMMRLETRGLLTRENETEALLKQQNHYANIAAARTFLRMGEQRDSLGSREALSARSSIDQHIMPAKFSGQQSETTGNKGLGLTEQVIKKNTLDKTRPKYIPLGGSVTE